ncbi:low specificity L-threonine aldolase [Actinoplanes sp. TFC3]|uniref:threonine aldolase family protein n=1 Tax=Actinoplanes sp. TFC3 TaxID=1710355 RepID=UPI000833BDE3|nr:beta-eliminating lyase-related protein [Actinoplanes sp. TFC3]
MDDEVRALKAACTDTFLGNGLGRSRDLLATIDPDAGQDVYGDGGVVKQLEERIAALLGKPAAVFLPSGTMAQAATLRVHADRRGTRTIAWHPYCHLERHESQAHQRLHQLVGRSTGDLSRLLELSDLEKIAEPLAALVLELPQRDLGGQLPSWEDLAAQTGWARDRGAAVHLDGARLWEATAGYERSTAEIAALFDTVYVSFYKGVGALPGCCVAGPEQDIAQVREWRSRLGGTLFALWPAASSALARLDVTLEEMPARMRHARAIAEALQSVPEVRVLPDPPQTPMMHLLFATSADAFRATSRRLAEQTGLWLWPTASPTAEPGFVVTELTVGSATLRHKPEAIAEILSKLCT